MTSVIILITNGYIRAREKKFDQKMDAFNEVKLMIIMYHMMCFTLFIADPITKFKIGYSCFAFIVIGLTVNMTMLFVSPVVLLKRWCKVRKYKKKIIKQTVVIKPKFNASGF